MQNKKSKEGEGMSNSSINRRSFLKGAAGLGAAAAVGTMFGCAPEGSAEPAQGDEQEGTTSKGSWMSADSGIFNWRNKPEEPTEFADTLSADVVVLGAGISGLCAARSAAENGAKVIVVEAAETHQIRGYQCAALNPKMARDQGIEVDPMAFAKTYISQHAYRVNADLIHLWAQESGAAFDWFEEALPPVGQDPVTDYRSVLYWPRPEGWAESVADEEWKQYLGTIDFTMGSWKHSGDLLFEKCVSLGVEFQFDTKGIMLKQSEGSKVTGLIALNTAGEHILYEADKGVILCAGGFCEDEDMVKEIDANQCVYQLRNNDEIDYKGLFIVSGEGLGHKMAVWAGGDFEPWTCQSASSEPLFGPTPGLGVNNLGKRFRNEDEAIWMRPISLRSQPDQMGWEIFDANWKELLPLTSIGHRAIDTVVDTPNTIPPKDANVMGDEETKTDGVKRYEDYLELDILAGVGNPEGVAIGDYCKRPGEVFAADTLEELADLMHLDADAKQDFLDTVARYNEMCEKGTDEDYGKRANLLKAITTPPFVACGAQASYGGGLGAEGIQVNKNLEVIGKDGRALGGLWTAGILTGGRHANQYLTPMSGMNHGFGVTLGKIAGENAAKS